MPVSLSGVDLNLLVALDALLSERNVTRAAEHVSVGQPAMSASLARLRKQLNDPLLVRDGRGYVLTTLGASLVEPVRAALAAAGAVLGPQPSFNPAADGRSFTIVASEYTALMLLRPLLMELADEAPNVQIKLATVGPTIDERLRRGTIDLLISPTELATNCTELPLQKLFDDSFVLVAAAANLDVADGMSIEQFLRLPYLAVAGSIPNLISRQLADQGITVHPQATMQGFAMVPLMVSGTHLVAFLQKRLAQTMAESAQLRLVEPPIPIRSLTEEMFWDGHSTADPGHRWLRERLVAQAARLT